MPRNLCTGFWQTPELDTADPGTTGLHACWQHQPVQATLHAAREQENRGCGDAIYRQKGWVQTHRTLTLLNKPAGAGAKSQLESDPLLSSAALTRTPRNWRGD